MFNDHLMQIIYLTTDSIKPTRRLFNSCNSSVIPHSSAQVQVQYATELKLDITSFLFIKKRKHRIGTHITTRNKQFIKFAECFVVVPRFVFI